MLSIPAGRYEPWKDFSLELTSPLIFSPEYNYYLCGDNGSGKSSFIKKIMLPKLNAMPNIYVLYWEQQIQLQLYALKAHAAFGHHDKRIDTDMDALMYLFEDLGKALNREKRPVFFVVDECLYFENILSRIHEHGLNLSLIFTHHDGCHGIDALRTIEFKASSPNLGVMHER